MLFSLKYRRKFTIEHVENIYNILSILGLTPIFDFKNNSIKFFIFTTLRSIFLCLLTCSLYAYCLYGSIFSRYVKINGVSSTVDALYYLFLAIFNFLICISPLRHRKNWTYLLDKLNKEKWRTNVKITKKETQYLNIEFTLTMLLIAGILIVEVSKTIMNLSWDTSYIYIISRLQIFYMFLELYCTFVLTFCVKNKLEHFNNVLHCVFEKKLKKDVTVENKIIGFMQTYKDIRWIFDVFNWIFGWKILVFMGLLILKMLETMNIIIFIGDTVFANMKKEIDIYSFITTFLFLVSILNLS